MQLWIVNIALAFVLCVVLAGIVIPQILLIAFRKKLFDLPDERKIHQGVVPRLGGIAFKPVIFFSVALLLGVNILIGNTEFLDEVGRNVTTLSFVFCAVMLLYLVGMADDLIGVRYVAKFFVQILCGIMLIGAGVWLSDFHGILWVGGLYPWFGYLFTVLVIVFIINAINLIDGIDGLASGLCSVACIYYGISFFSLGEYICSLLSFATLGVLIPFFYYNVFGKAERGRKIFMGDTGSLTVGIMVCFLSLKLVRSAAGNPAGFNPMVLAFAPLIIPCFDVIRVYMRRVRHGQNPFMPDKSHIHHKLLAMGMPQRQTMISIVLASIVLTFLNVWLSRYVHVNLLLIADAAIWILFNMWLTKRIKDQK